MPEPLLASLDPQELKELLEKLDDVMAEALRLRHEVSRQLAEQNREQLQEVSNPVAAPGSRSRRR